MDFLTVKKILNNDSSVEIQILEKLLNGDYINILNNDQLSNIFHNDIECPSNSLELQIVTHIKDYIKKYPSTQIYLDILCLGIASLEAFIQINWTGPELTTKENFPLPWLKKLHQSISGDDFESDVLSCLLLDGESISPVARNLELLLFARTVLISDCLNTDNIHPVIFYWSRLHCLSIHQQILEELSNELYKELCTVSEILLKDKSIAQTKKLKGRLHLECARIHLLYNNVSKSNHEIKSAFELLEMEVNYTGALGKRTKFQQKEVAQLTLKVEINDDASEIERNTIACEHLPRDVHLDDEVRLNAISFSDNDITLFPTMSETHHAAVIGLFIHRLKSQPNDDIRTEQLMPHLTCLLSQPLVWSLRMASLYYRSKLESKHSRTVERALMQIQALVDAVKSPEPSGNQRLYMVHTSYLPPHWKIEAEMANMLVSLGAIQSALDIFLRLQLWEEVIACYNCLKLRHKAAEIIRKELEKEETVKMWCLLGDATDDINCYQKAWELSGEKSGRVQRHWALYYYSRKQYAESIPHLIKSLEVNSLQVSLWFNLGYAALDSEDWQLCASAYKRYCSLEPDSFEAWNNLAKALLKLGNKPAAYSALHEAVKCNFNNWKVWDNLMAVSTDCANFEEVINCYHRILDLKEKHIDIEVLKILTTAISKDLSDCHEKPASRHRKKALVLFGRITAQVVNNATVWQLYAQTTASSEQDNESNTKIAQYLQKAHRAATQGNWERDENTCNEVIHLCKDLAHAYQACRNRCKTPSEAANFMTSAKLSIKGVLTKIEKEQRDLITGELPESLKNNYKDLEQIYNVIVHEISTLQSS